MKFGAVRPRDAEGAIAVHSIRQGALSGDPECPRVTQVQIASRRWRETAAIGCLKSLHPDVLSTNRSGGAGERKAIFELCRS